MIDLKERIEELESQNRVLRDRATSWEQVAARRLETIGRQREELGRLRRRLEGEAPAPAISFPTEEEEEQGTAKAVMHE